MASMQLEETLQA